MLELRWLDLQPVGAPPANAHTADCPGAEIGRQGCGVDAPHGGNSVLSSLFPCLRLAQSLFALFASSLAISVVFAIIPLCHNVVVLAVVMAVAGLAMGCIDTISNMQLVKIYQKDSAIFLQVSVEPASPLACASSPEEEE